MIRNEKFLKIAKTLEPQLIETMVRPVEVQLQKNVSSEMTKVNDDLLSTGDRVIFDFGNHFTGYLSFKMVYEGHHPDAPVWIKVSFAERLCEFEEKAEEYKGWISKGWIQQEQLHVDVVPCEISMPRRYAFRYIAVEILDCSTRFQVKVEEPVVKAVSSADDNRLTAYKFKGGFSSESDEVKQIERLDEIATRTLHECMQSVFEDGPKRDRRLWLGDLRLEALANYETYKQNDLVKRCLYLFAGNTLDNGQVAANLFLEPEVEADNQAMLDYSLFYIPTLLEYVKQTGDMDTLKDLYETATKQVEIMETYFDENQVIRDSNQMGWVFVDWNLELNRQASAQGICLYALNSAIELAELYGDEELVKKYKESYELKRTAAREVLYDSKNGVFVSGDDKQLSWASQCWMIIGKAVEENEGAEILERIKDYAADSSVKVAGMSTPYMYHHYVEALIMCNKMDEAMDVMRSYWGKMAEEGADTFWELYNPANPSESPYGGTIVNSYCHAWSCAPAYFLRKYF